MNKTYYYVKLSSQIIAAHSCSDTWTIRSRNSVGNRNTYPRQCREKRVRYAISFVNTN